MKRMIFLFIAAALSLAVADDKNTYRYTGEPLTIPVSKADMTNFVFDENIIRPIKMKEQNLEFDIAGKHVYFRFMPKVKYRVLEGGVKEEVSRTLVAKRSRFYLVGESGRHYEIIVVPREGFGHTVTVHAEQYAGGQEPAGTEPVEKVKEDTRNNIIKELAKMGLRGEEIRGYRHLHIGQYVGHSKLFNVYLKDQWVGPTYQVDIYGIKALKRFEPDELIFKGLPTKNQVFITVYDWEKPYLKPGEMTTVVIVGQH